MNPVTIIAGRMVPLDRADIDTDQIMPKQFLKRIERTGFGEFVFYEWRQSEEFVLNDPAYEGANVLLTGLNFGSGSSREHAPWGLQQYGFQAIIPQFCRHLPIELRQGWPAHHRTTAREVPAAVPACRGRAPGAPSASISPSSRS